MKKTLFILSLAGIILASCSKEKDPFLITATHVGHLTKETKISQLDSIFAQDSLVKTPADKNFMSKEDQVEIFEKGGAKLLLISPKKNNDPEAKISNIQVFDSRYKTDKGLHINSTFKDVKDHYTISSVLNTMRSVVISVAEADVYITIDKEKLPEAIRNEFGVEVEAKDIPDDATFKFFMVGWEKED